MNCREVEGNVGILVLLQSSAGGYPGNRPEPNTLSGGTIRFILRCISRNWRRTFGRVRINMQYRALARKRGELIVWFWIGTHQEYDSLISRY